MIEFALTLPLLVPLMLFMIEYGHYFWVTLERGGGGEAGARVHRDPTKQYQRGELR